VSGISLVIGGTGKVGAPLVSRLVDEGRSVRSASRSGSGQAGVVFDWNSPDTYTGALAGVDRTFMVAPIGSSDPIAVMKPFIEQAIASGVKRFVLLSSSLIDEGGPAMGAVHALLRQIAPEWAVLRPSWFMQNFTIEGHVASIKFEDAIYSATDDGVVPFISVDDIAEVALRTLTGATPVNDGVILTGPATLSYADVATAIGAARGKPVRHIQLTADALAERFAGFGIPPEFAQMLAGLDRAIAAGAEARTTDDVHAHTGKAPMSFAAFATANAEIWAPPAI
jgi:uncharacterized protein YbjT (DUF2867 family)